MTFEGKAKLFWSETNLAYRVDIALYVHPKNSLQSHLRAIMALYRSR